MTDTRAMNSRLVNPWIQAIHTFIGSPLKLLSWIAGLHLGWAWIIDQNHDSIFGLDAKVESLLLLAIDLITTIALVWAYTIALRADNTKLRTEHDKEQEHLISTRDAIIFGLAKLADYRDSDTGKHLERIATFSDLLAHAYIDPKSTKSRKITSPADGPVTDEWIAQLRLASSLHDIGKVGIPDAILLKPGSLDPHERRFMEQHAIIGADTLIAIRDKLGNDDLINMGIAIALQHHEKWDGSGYPFGLQGDEISIAARIVTLADFYDALTSERVYKKAQSHDFTRQLILDSNSTHFDPAVVEAFERVQHQFAEIRQRLQAEDQGEVPYVQRAGQQFMPDQDATTNREAA